MDEQEDIFELYNQEIKIKNLLQNTSDDKEKAELNAQFEKIKGLIIDSMVSATERDYFAAKSK